MTIDVAAVAVSIRLHADQVEDLRYRLEEVRFTSSLMVRDNTAYGSMCAWINDYLEKRARRQDEIVEYLAGNLEIAARRLRATADAFEGRLGAPRLAKVTAVSYWAPEGESAPKVDFETKPRLAGVTQRLVETMSVQAWATGELAERHAVPVPEFESSMVDVVPMREIEARLLGQPDLVAAQVAAWNDMSRELHRIAQELQDLLEHGMPEWKGEAHAAYCWLMDHNVNAATALSAAAAGMAAAVEGAGVVVTSTLRLVRERSAELAVQLVVWAADDAVGRSVTSQHLVAAVAKWALMVVSYLTALSRSLDNLKERLGYGGGLET